MWQNDWQIDRPRYLGSSRRVAVYMDTHYNVALKKVFPPAYSTADSVCYFIYAYFILQISSSSSSSSSSSKIL